MYILSSLLFSQVIVGFHDGPAQGAKLFRCQPGALWLDVQLHPIGNVQVAPHLDRASLSWPRWRNRPTGRRIFLLIAKQFLNAFQG
jgi:hypothetical protein